MPVFGQATIKLVSLLWALNMFDPSSTLLLLYIFPFMLLPFYLATFSKRSYYMV